MNAHIEKLEFNNFDRQPITIHVMRDKINEIISYLNGEGEEKPHEHQSCEKKKLEIFWKGDEKWNPEKFCCLCHPHDGCELDGRITLLAELSDEKKTLEHHPSPKQTENLMEQIKSAKPAGWEESIRQLFFELDLSEAEAKLGEKKACEIIRQVEREAKLAGFDEAVKIAHTYYTNRGQTIRFNKKRSELLGKPCWHEEDQSKVR